MRRFISLTLVGVMAISVVLALAGRPAVSIASPNLTPTLPPLISAHLPVINKGATPTPPPTPLPPPDSPAAVVMITRYTEINASTYNRDSFIVENRSKKGVLLKELRIDLSTAVFPDMVFDPDGKAGDTTAKDVTKDTVKNVSDFNHHYEAPHDGGYDVLVLRFERFDRGGSFGFSVDVDPTSIRGVDAPGPMETGSVGGLELVGATITARFDDGTTLTNQVYRLDDPGEAGDDHSGAVAHLQPGRPERPQIMIPGVAAPSVVNQSSQTIRVSGPVGRPVVVMVVEGGLFTEEVPGGGFDLDPFEANTALTVREYRGVIGPAGTVDIPIVLTRSVQEVEGDVGINHITAVFDNHYGVKELTAEPMVLHLQQMNARNRRLQ